MTPAALKHHVPLFQPGERPALMRRHRLIEEREPAPKLTPAKLLRQRIIRVPLPVMLQCLSGQLRITNFPEGAALVSSWYDSIFDGSVEIEKLLCLRIEHESLPEVMAGCKLPTFGAVLARKK